MWKQHEPCPETPDVYSFYEALKRVQMTPKATSSGLVKVECCKFLNKIPSLKLIAKAPKNGGFPIGISFSRGLFSGAMLVSRGVM